NRLHLGGELLAGVLLGEQLSEINVDRDLAAGRLAGGEHEEAGQHGGGCPSEPSISFHSTPPGWIERRSAPRDRRRSCNCGRRGWRSRDRRSPLRRASCRSRRPPPPPPDPRRAPRTAG